MQVDTLDVVVKHFTGRDVVSRWDRIGGLPPSRRASSSRRSNSECRFRCGFDGGSEFAAEFERACQQRGLRLFVLPPRSPKLNPGIEQDGGWLQH